MYNEAILVSTKVKDGSKLIRQEDLKLRIRRASRFKKEPLIDYLITMASSELGTMAIYNVFTTTSSLEEFCEQIKLDKEHASGFNKRAHEEYKLLRNVYLDENNPVDNSQFNDEIEEIAKEE